MPFAIMRVAQLTNKSRGKGSVGGAIRHLENHDKAAEISRPELSYLNKTSKNAKTYAEAKEIAKANAEKHNKAIDEWNKNNPDKQKRHLKKDTSQFFEVIMTFSPEAESSIDYEKWIQKNIEFLKSEFKEKGCQLIRMDIHADENCLHFHSIHSAFDEQNQNCTSRNILGNKADLCAIQDRYANFMEEFQLERGHSRYREYQSVKAQAENRNMSIEDYAEEFDIDLPKRRHHKSIGEWKAEQQATGKALEMKVDNLKEQVESLKRLKQDALEDCIDPEEFKRLTKEKLRYKTMVESSKDVNYIRADGTECSVYDLIIEAAKERVELIREIEKPEEEISITDDNTSITDDDTPITDNNTSL